MDNSDIKSKIRIKQTKIRDNISNCNVAEKITELFLNKYNIENKIIAGYFPIKSELNILPLLKKCKTLDAKICLPCIIDINSNLIFRLWDCNKNNLEKKIFNTYEPNHSFEKVIPDIILTPMLAFNNNGYRLGYGGGYYDRTFQKLNKRNIIRIGIAFENQYNADIPIDKHDIPLYDIVTEKKIYTFKKGTY